MARIDRRTRRLVRAIYFVFDKRPPCYDNRLPELSYQQAALSSYSAFQTTSLAAARPATRPEKRQPPRNVPSSAR